MEIMRSASFLPRDATFQETSGIDYNAASHRNRTGSSIEPLQREDQLAALNVLHREKRSREVHTP